MNRKSSDAVWWLRVIGFAEGVSLLVLLCIAMPLKYLAGRPGAVKYVGWAHGVLFIAFLAFVFYVYLKRNWKFKTLVYAFIAAFLPFGTFVYDRWLVKQQHLLN